MRNSLEMAHEMAVDWCTDEIWGLGAGDLKVARYNCDS